MPRRKFHLAWFTNFTADEWLDPLSAAGGTPWDGDFFVEFAQILERACFDYIMLEDTLMLSEAYGGSTEHYLKHAIQVPKHDPAPLTALMGARTSRIGVVATLSTLGLSAVLAGAPLLDDRPHRGRPIRLEYRDQRRRYRRAEFRPGQAAGA